MANRCGTTLNAAGTCQLGIRFTPTTEGLKQGQLVIVAGTYAALAGIGLNNTNIAGLSSFDFGTIRIGTTSPKTYTIKNNNVGPTGPIAVTLSGADASDFVVAAPGPSNSCTGNDLQAGESCSFRVDFAPGAVTGFGPQNATVTVSSDAVGPNGVPANGGISVSAALMGSGANAADISITPATTQADGNRAVGAIDPAPSVFRITNSMSSAATGHLHITGFTDEENFAFATTGLTNPCVFGNGTSTGTVLAGGQFCEFAIAFNPTETTAHTTTLTVEETDAGGTLDSVTATVTGTGTEQLTGPTNPQALTANMNTTLTFTNNASVSTNPLIVDTTGLGTQVSVITDNCVSKVLTAAGTAGSTCTIIVRYIPDGLAGATNAVLVVSSTVDLTSPPFGDDAPATTDPSFACDPAGCTFNP
jgi:hypothetical protein